MHGFLLLQLPSGLMSPWRKQLQSKMSQAQHDVCDCLIHLAA